MKVQCIHILSEILLLLSIFDMLKLQVVLSVTCALFDSDGHQKHEEF